MKPGLRRFLEIVLFAFVALSGWIIIRFIILPKTPVYYRSPAVSAVIVDAFTGKPIEGATVQVRWSALRPRGWHGSDSMDIHIATVTTDSNGVFTTPAWGTVAVAREWRYYSFDPMVSFSKPGYKPSYKDNHDNQDSVTSSAIPFFPVTLKLPSWANSVCELDREAGNIRPTSQDGSLFRMPAEVSS